MEKNTQSSKGELLILHFNYLTFSQMGTACLMQTRDELMASKVNSRDPDHPIPHQARPNKDFTPKDLRSSAGAPGA